MAILRRKVYHRKSAFFEMEKKLKIGRRWPEPSGTVRDGFRTPPQKHLTPFHKKIMVRSSILKKISSTKRGSVISGQHGTTKRGAFDKYMLALSTIDITRCDDIQRKVLFINAYNALAIRQILDFYDLHGKLPKSILDICGHGIWKKAKCNIAGIDLSLDEIEHGILRTMRDARIHSASNISDYYEQIPNRTTVL